MINQIRDEEVRILAALAAGLQKDYISPELDPWAGSPFAWIRTVPSRQRGKIGEQLIAGWCAAKGLAVVPTGDAEADRIIDGERVEIKFSTLWVSGVYKFQQFRNQNYSQVICLGIAPFDAHAWMIPKTLLAEPFVGRRQLVGLTHQHGGKTGRDTWWLSFPTDSPPDWLTPYGGTLAKVFQLLRQLKHG